LPAHCTSTGKALLASCDPQAVRLLYPRERLPVLTPHSLNSRKALEAELAIVRERGYATSTEESEDGVASVATLLGDFAGSKYALNISAPVTRMTEVTQKEFAAQVLQAAQDIKSYFM
jgi:DNA-binding IclR family transcriptional regulator